MLDFLKNDFNIIDNPFAFTLKANQKGECAKTFEANVKFLRDKDGHTTGQVSNDVTLKKKHECWNSKWKVDAKSLNFEKEYTPKDWKNENHIFALKFVGKSVPQDTQFNWTSEGRFGFLNLHKDFKIFGALATTCGSDKKLPTTFSLIVNALNNYNIGFSVSRDLKTQGAFKPDSINATFAGKLNNDLNIFARFDVLKNHAEIGGTYSVRDFIDKVGWHYFFDIKEGNLANHHLASVVEKRYNDETLFRTKFESKDKILVTNSVQLKVTDNLKVKLVDQIAPLEAWKNKSFGSYKYGASFDFEF